MDMAHRKVRMGGATAIGAVLAAALVILGACETGPTPQEIAAMDWQSAARSDTPPAYATYIRMHPDGDYVTVARQRTEELRLMARESFEAAQRIDTEEAYDGFLRRFPWAADAAAADARRAVLAAPRLAAEEKKAWEQTSKSGRIEIYEDFLKAWPKGAHAVEARIKLDALWRTDQGAFVRAVRSGSPAELRAFINAWPNSSYVADARRELDLVVLRDDEAWRRALADNSIRGYDFYLQSQPFGKWRLEASRALEDLRERDYRAWQYAAAIDQVWAYENYRNLYPWGVWHDTAFYRIDWIRRGRDWYSWDHGWDHGWRWRDADRDWRGLDDHNRDHPPPSRDTGRTPPGAYPSSPGAAPGAPPAAIPGASSANPTGRPPGKYVQPAPASPTPPPPSQQPAASAVSSSPAAPASTTVERERLADDPN